MAMYGQGLTRGRVALLGIDAAINQACAAIFTDETISGEFLFCYLTDQYDSIRELGHGANQKNLNAGIIRAIQVPLPPCDAQGKIVQALSAIDKKIQVEEQGKTALRTLFKTMLHLLMTGQVRVGT